MISRSTRFTRLFPQRMIQIEKTLKSQRNLLKSHKSLLAKHKEILERNDKLFDSIFGGGIGLFIGLVYVSRLVKK